MFNSYMKYTAFLIAAYLAVTHASGVGTVFTSGANGLSTIDKTLQGR
jgi:hypothetical protein